MSPGSSRHWKRTSARCRPLPERTVATPLPGLIWGLPLAALPRLAQREPRLAAVPPAAGIPVSVIIPARNESDNLERVVRSILASTYDAFELIIVDDRSTDDTARRAAEFAAQDSRVRVIAGAELPAGWFGKPWACAQGAAVATGRYLLFTDADTQHAPALLGHAVGALEADPVDLLTLASRQECRTFWERLVMPQIIAMLGIRYAPSTVNRATRPDQVVANGQFIMMPRASYEAIGGHGAVRHSVVEDLALAQLIVSTGRRMRLMVSDDLLHTRMYRSLGELVEGWSKNLYVGAIESTGSLRLLRGVAPVALTVNFLFWLLPPVAIVAGHLTAATAIAVGCSALFWVVIAIGMGIPAWYGFLYPLGALVSLGIVARSIWRGRRRIEWRGRRYGG